MKKSKIKTAVALKYDKTAVSVPKVTASSKGHIAEKMVALAMENKIPVYKNPLLAQSLSALQIGQEIPNELYEAVAQILVYIMHADQLFDEHE